jgi:hypothetical protein
VIGVEGKELRKVRGFGDARLQPAGCGLPCGGEHGAQDFFPVNAALDCLAYAWVIEGLDVSANPEAMYESEVAGHLDFEPGFGEGVEDLGRDVVGDISLMGACRGGPEGVVG